MSKSLKTAFFSALLVLAVASPVLGLKLTTVGIKLEVHGASASALWIIAGCAVLMFAWQLLRNRFGAAWAASPKLPGLPGQASNFLTLPSTQRWIILGLILVALAWPFFGSRGAVDIATLILIYIMLGLGLNIVVGLAGLLDLGYVGFYAVGAYSYALLSHYYGLGFGEIIRILLRNMTELTGGPNGISNIEKPTLFGRSFERKASEGMQTFHEYFGLAYNSINKVVFLYLIALLLVLLTLFVINRLLRMPIGRAWEALREDEIADRKSTRLNSSHSSISYAVL